MQPERLANGYRIYNEEDVNTLLGVKALAEQGVSIKQATTIVHEENSQGQLRGEKNKIIQHEVLNSHVMKLLEKGVHCDEVELNFILQQAYHNYGLEAFLSTVITPFLREIGNSGKKGNGMSTKRLFRAVVQDYLVQIRRNYRCRDNAPLL